MAETDDLFEDEETETPAASDNRDAIIQRLQKKNEKLEAKIEEARKAAFEEATKSFERRGKALEVGGGMGLKPRAIESFLKENPEADITPEAIKPWAEEYGFPVTTEEQTEASEEKAPPAAASFHAGGGGTTTGAGPMTWAEYSEKSKADPAAAALEAQKRGLQQLGGLGELTPA